MPVNMTPALPSVTVNVNRFSFFYNGRCRSAFLLFTFAIINFSIMFQTCEGWNAPLWLPTQGLSTRTRTRTRTRSHGPMATGRCTGTSTCTSKYTSTCAGSDMFPFKFPVTFPTSAVLAFATLFLFHVEPIHAFENAVQVVNVPKTRGPKPATLGLDSNNLLRRCLKPTPNCFSTTPDLLLDSDSYDEDEDSVSLANGIRDVHTVKPWVYKQGSASEAYDAIGAVLDAYEPGQGGIDGGGFKVIVRDPSKHYYYVQFESLKRGYIDDVEIAVKPDGAGTVQVVSSSRIGYLDYQVNAKRLNYIAQKLQKVGFEASLITPETHPVYFESNVAWEGPGLGLGKKDY